MDRWLFLMWRWSRNPPPLWKVKLAFAVFLIVIALFAVEQTVGWPDWLTVNRKLR